MSKFFTEDNMYNRAMTKVFDLCVLSLLAFICCIPVVTAGASITAMYAVMLKMARDQEGPIVKSFFVEFRGNLKGSLGGWLVILAGFVLLVVDLSLWTQNEVEYRSVFYGLTVAMVVALCAFADWYFAVRAKFNETSKSALINAGKFALVYLPASIVMGAYTVGIAVLVMHFPMVIMFVPLVGLTLLGYPKAMFIRGRFDRYIESREDLQTAEADEDSVPDEKLAGADNEELVKAAAIDEEGETVDGGQGVNRTVNATDKTQKKSEPANSEGESGGKRAGLWQQFLFYHKQEKEKMSDMTKEQKWDYLLTYYKSWFVMGALVLLILFGAGYHFIFNNAKCGFQCVLVNGYMDKSDTVFSDEISDYFGYEPRRQYAYFDTQYQIAYTDVENVAADTSFYEKFFLNIRAGLLDAAIVPESFMEYCNDIEQVFYDVKDVLTEKQVENYEPYFVMGKDEEGNEYVCGIDISGFAFIEKEGVGFVNTNQEDAFILTFPINGQHPESCQGFVDFLEQYE